MDRMLLLLQEVSDPRLGGANSFCDRLNCKITVSILGVFALLITTRQYVGEPISCWCPVHFSGSNVDYANKVCWTMSTYYLPWEVDRIPKEDEEDKVRSVSYYQWVTIFLVFISFLFYCPHLLWRALNRKSGVALYTITDAAIERQRKTDRESADKVMRYIVKQVGRFLLELSRDAANTNNKWKKFWLAIYGNYLITVYLFIKLLYIGNVILNIYIINAFLGHDGSGYHLYGFEVMKKLFAGENWTTSDRFPRVTLCNFKLRILGNINRYTVQCTLPMNLLNEIFFIFIWFWFVMVLIASTLSFLVWFINLLCFRLNFILIRNRLIAMDRDKAKKEVKIDKFVTDYLRRDGCLIVRLVLENTSDHIGSELIAGLFEHYKENRKRIEKLLAEDSSELQGINTLNKDSNQERYRADRRPSHVDSKLA